MNIFKLAKAWSPWGTKAAPRLGSGVSIGMGVYSDESAVGLNDPKIRCGNFLRAYKTDARVSQAVDERINYLAGGTWEIIPASEEPKDMEIADFLNANLLGEDDEAGRFGRSFWMRNIWEHIQEEIAFSMLIYGHYVGHKLFRKVGDYIILDKLTYIEPSTIDRWVLDDEDQIQSITRSYTKPSAESVFSEIMDAKDLTIFTYRLIGANYQGISLVRTMWPAFFRKEFFQKLKMIAGKRRLVPVPVLKLDDSIRPGSPEWIKLEQFMISMCNMNIDSNYLMSSVIPEFLEQQSTQTLQELAAWISDENNELAAAGSTKGLSLGDQEVGARSLGESMGERELPALKRLAESIERFANFGIGGLKGLVPELVDLNFPGVESYPYLSFRPNETQEAVNNAKIFAEFAKANLITMMPSDEMKLREAIGYDDNIDEEMITVEKDKRKAEFNKNTTPDNNTPDDSGADDNDPGTKPKPPRTGGGDNSPQDTVKSGPSGPVNMLPTGD